MKYIAIGMLSLFVLFLLALFGPKNDDPSARALSKNEETVVDYCVQRGIGYYREIGSYPNLSDGRTAISVAREKCRRTLGKAF